MRLCDFGALRTLPWTPPVFGDTLGDIPGTLRARRARSTPVAGRGVRKNRIMLWDPEMARLERIDSQIRENRLILANRFRVPELNPFFPIRASRELKIANRRFEAIRTNRLHIMKIG